MMQMHKRGGEEGTEFGNVTEKRVQASALGAQSLLASILVQCRQM